MKRSTRRRVARFVAVAGIAVVGVYLFQSFPREVSIRFALGPDHGVVTQARIAYLDEESGEAVKGVRLDYPEGAPKTFRHRVDLPPGHYDVRAELRGPSLTRTVTRSLEVPAEGLVHMDLFEQAYALLMPSLRSGRGPRSAPSRLSPAPSPLRGFAPYAAVSLRETRTYPRRALAALGLGSRPSGAPMRDSHGGR